MKVSSSAYYARARSASGRETEAQAQWREKVKACFYEHRRRYGSRRIAGELSIGRCRVRSAMKREAIKAIAPKAFVPKTTDSKHASRISPNLLAAKANQPKGCGEVMVGDKTYLPLKGGGFCYLATFQDKYTRR
jgi:putative transposase